MSATLASTSMLPGAFVLLLVAAALVMLISLAAVVLIGVGTVLAGLGWALRAIVGLGRAARRRAVAARLIRLTPTNLSDQHLRPAA